MHKSKLIHLFSSLSKKEIRRFEQFTQSPFFNSDAYVVKLLNYLKPLEVNESNPKLERQFVFKKITRGKSYDEKSMRYLMAKLTRLLEKFLVWIELEEDENREVLLQLRSFNKRGLDKFFHNTLKKHDKKLEEGSYRNIRYLLHQYELRQTVAEYEFDRSSAQAETLINVSESLDLFYISNKMRYACETLNYKNVLKAEYEQLLLEEITGLIEEKCADLPMINIYYLIYKTLKDSGNEKEFNQLLHTLEENKELFTGAELSEYYTYARNFCVKKLNEGQMDYYPALFDLYQNALENDFYTNWKDFTQWDYKNINVLSLRLKHFEFARQFIEEKKVFIPLTHRENAYKYNLAFYYFYLKDYDKTLSVLQSVDFSNPYYYLNSKTIMCKAYYHCDEVIPLYSLLDSIKVYLSRNKKVSDYQRKAYAQFISYIKKMIRIKMGSKVKPSKVLEQLREKRGVIDFFWLEEQLEILSKNLG